MKSGDIVKFRLLDDDGKLNSSDAARFCAKYQITGVVVSTPTDHGQGLGRFVVDACLGYTIYAVPEELNIVVTREQIPTIVDGE